MTTIFKAQIFKDLENKRIKVTREFDAAPEKVWRAWTEPELLDQWWAPRPWMAKTRSLNFSEGGHWLYAMVGPDGTEHWCKVDFSSIKKFSSFQTTATFCDNNGTRNTDLPIMNWDIHFSVSGEGTMVEVVISFDKASDLETIINMGFEAGFTAALGNLDELLGN